MEKADFNLENALKTFAAGENYHAEQLFGPHRVEEGYLFRVWAPNAQMIWLVGDFNDWEDTLPMEKDGYGVWSVLTNDAKEGQLYKFKVKQSTGRIVYKIDPYAMRFEERPNDASIIHTIPEFKWSDGLWRGRQKRSNYFERPLNIYEVHAGSWKNHDDGRPYDFDDLTEELVPYLKKMNYTHVEFMPLMEHPLDASWGYQVTGYYSPSSRSGSPADFKYLVDSFHKAGIGVILDWVPGHFCPDDHGLRDFNGSMLYESEIHPDWGTYKFDFGRPQVRSFLLSNAMFWIDEYHADGLRVDGVSSMLYLNFGVSDKSKMKFNKYGDEGNLEAIDFLRELNYMIGTNCSGVFTAAEESSAWPMVTKPPKDGGLGFHFKWNMGWMNDTLEYMSTDFPWREGAHNKLTFSMTYAYSENYILPLSHDEVVHGKKSLIGRMPGDIWRQFAGIRLLATYQMTFPGKKLNFMGHEIAQFIEWREYEGLEWFLLGYENHEKYQKFVKDLNHVYTEHPALWSEDNSWDGFNWIDPDDRQQNVLLYLRRGKAADGKDGELLICALNMGVKAFDEFEIGVPEPGFYKEIINSDDVKYAGSGRVNTRQVRARKKPMHGMPYSIRVKMPVVGGAIFRKKDKKIK